MRNETENSLVLFLCFSFFFPLFICCQVAYHKTLLTYFGCNCVYGGSDSGSYFHEQDFDDIDRELNVNAFRYAGQGRYNRGPQHVLDAIKGELQFSL